MKTRIFDIGGHFEKQKKIYQIKYDEQLFDKSVQSNQLTHDVT